MKDQTLRKIALAMLFSWLSISVTDNLGASFVSMTLKDFLDNGDVNGAMVWFSKQSQKTQEMILMSIWDTVFDGTDITFRIDWEHDIWGEGTCTPKVHILDDRIVICKIPVDPVQRFLATYALRGARVLWVASGSTEERARQIWETATVPLDALTIVVSCPPETYQDPTGKTLWDGAIAAIQGMIEELELPCHLTDLSGYEANVAVDVFKKVLASPSQAVLGFFHRGKNNAFELGQGGSFNVDDLDSIHVDDQRDYSRFVALLGCNEHLYGMSDKLIERGLASFTLTAGETFNADQLRTFLEELFHFLASLRGSSVFFRDLIEHVSAPWICPKAWNWNNMDLLCWQGNRGDLRNRKEVMQI